MSTAVGEGLWPCALDSRHSSSFDAALVKEPGSLVEQTGQRRTLLALGCYKVLFFVLAYLVVRLVPWWNAEEWPTLLHWPPVGAPTAISPFATWDAAHYLRLASEGYQSGTNSCAFYPLWPFLIWLGAFVTRNLFWSGILLANILSFAASWQFFKLVQERFGLRTAQRSLFVMLVMPGAIFFNFIYAESLFLLLLLLFFRFLHQNNYLGLAIASVLLPLTKAVGIFIVVPLFWHLYSQRRPAKEFAWLAAPMLGYFTYFYIMYHFTGNPFEGFDAQGFYPTQPSAERLIDLGGRLRALCAISVFQGGTDAFVDRANFLVVALSLPLVWRLDKTYFGFALFAGLVPAFSNSFWSYSRLMIICFPVFIAFADAYERNKQFRGTKIIFWFYLTLALSVQAYFLVLYLNFRWSS